MSRSVPEAPSLAAERDGTHGRLAVRLAASLAERIAQHALRPGTKLPSIRRFALDQGVSRSTVVDVFAQLEARGLVEARHGSGFYVSGVARAARSFSTSDMPPAATPAIDVMWLLRAMLQQAPAGEQLGAGVLPAAWLDCERVARAVRAVGRTGGQGLLGYGQPAGYGPLREALARQLGEVGLDVDPAQIVTSAGVTQGLDLVLRHFVKPGDTVLVEDPAWYLLFARLAAFGVRMVGVPRTIDGPDLVAAEALIAQHRPRLFFVQSVLHNPTGTSLSPACAHRLLRLAEQYEVTLVEDDIYGDLHRGAHLRLAQLDGLRRTIYLGGFSKTLAASLRVGYLVASVQLARALADLKMLGGITTSELTERVVTRVLADGGYRRHVEAVRTRVDGARQHTLRELEAAGIKLFCRPEGGMFLWVDTGRDSHALAAAGAAKGHLFAPGSLFSATQAPSSWTRVSAAAVDNPAALRFLISFCQGSSERRGSAVGGT